MRLPQSLHSSWKALSRVVATALMLIWSLAAAAVDWPQEISSSEGTITIYQPQPDKLTGNVLSARAAMSLKLTGQEDLIFGVLWFTAKIDTDNDAGTALIRDVKVTNARWPESKDAGEQRFIAALEAALPNVGFEISLEQLSASLKNADMAEKSLADLKTDAPDIIFRDELAVLLIYDGDPRFSPVENSDYERVLNTPFVVVRKKGSNDTYLSSGTFWYRASDPLGPWTPTTSPPQDLVSMLPKPDSDEAAPSSPPAIVAVSTPTELIATQGAPDWQSLTGGQLLYVKNTESAWLRELSTGNMYLLLSGRWYRSKSQDGPWTFVRSDELPASFADIPPQSDIGGLRVSVAGTQEAEDAMLDAQIPQTAAIKRDEAQLDVEYDGSPEFEKIDGTDVSYAANTSAQVLQINNRYYAVDNGVWFTSNSAGGPWVVADTIPEDEIQQIPPSSPAYNTTYVHIYESTPEVVYVGYTPGYMWSYPYYGVPVYGTGWYYPPYWGRYYYPRPPTWGFHVGYNPWTGWNFGVSWSNGFFSMGIRWGGGYGGGYYPGRCCGGRYGGGYRGPVFINTGDINIGNNVNVGNRATARNNIDRDTRGDRSQRNLYNRPENRTRNADRATAERNLREARPATDRANNVFADRDGNVARKSGDQWETRQNGQWAQEGAARANVTPESRDRTQSAAQSRDIDRSSLNRSSNARQHGASRQAARPQNMRRSSGRRR